MNLFPDHVSLKGLFREIGKRVFQGTWTGELEQTLFNTHIEKLIFHYEFFEAEGLKSLQKLKGVHYIYPLEDWEETKGKIVQRFPHEGDTEEQNPVDLSMRSAMLWRYLLEQFGSGKVPVALLDSSGQTDEVPKELWYAKEPAGISFNPSENLAYCSHRIYSYLPSDAYRTEEEAIDASIHTEKGQLLIHKEDYFKIIHELFDEPEAASSTSPSLQSLIGGYENPYMELMVHVMEALKITSESQPKKETIVNWMEEHNDFIEKRWPIFKKYPLSKNLCNVMATLMRRPEMGEGGARKQKRLPSES